MKKVLVLGSLALMLSVSGCAKFTEPFKDAPRSNVTNSDPADTITFPDGFSNAATKCDHSNRLYVLYHGDNPYGSIAVVPNDPSCGGTP
jgi:hypothetical protein